MNGSHSAPIGFRLKYAKLRWLLTVICFFVMPAYIVSAYLIAKAETAQNGVDVIIALDCSGSMKHTDPETFAVTGAKLLLDQFDKSASRYGVVMFGGEIKKVLPLQALSSDALIATMKNAIETGYTKDDARTDTVRAVGRALQELESAPPENRRVIVLFTDGEEDPVRSMDELDKERAYVTERCAELGIPIYTIALDVDGSIPQDALKTLESTASVTNAQSYEISNAGQVEGVILDIFGDINKGNKPEPDIEHGEFPPGGVQYFYINIPNNYIEDANINFLSASMLTITDIITPDGFNVANDADKVHIGQDPRRYTTVQLIRPPAGQWILRVQGEEGIPYDVYLALLSSLIVTQQAADNAGGSSLTEDSANIECWFASEGMRVTDSSVYDSIEEVYIEITDASGQTRRFDAARGGGMYSADVGSLAAGDYESIAYVKLTNSDNRSSEPLKFTIAHGAAAASPAAPSNAPAAASPSSSAKAVAPPDNKFPWLIILIAVGAVVVLGGGAFAALKVLKPGGPAGKSNIKGSFSIDISDDDGLSEVFSAGGYFYTNALKTATLADVFEFFRVNDIGGSDVLECCRKVVFAGRPGGTIIASRDAKKVSVYSEDGKIDGYPALLDTGGGSAHIELKTAARTRITIRLES